MRGRNGRPRYFVDFLEDLSTLRRRKTPDEQVATPS